MPVSGHRGRGDAVGQRDHVEPLLERLPHRRLDAAVCHETAQRDRLDVVGLDARVLFGQEDG